MDLSQLLTVLDSIPALVWVILVFVVLFLLGDRKLWEFEAKFPLKPGVGRGEIEIECFKKRGAVIEAEFNLEPDYNGKAIDVVVGQQLALSIPARENIGSYFRFEQAYELAKPTEGARVEIKIDNELIFSAVLVLD